jgi:hypothetical protein
MTGTVADLCTLALKEIRSARAGDVPNPNDMADALYFLNEVFDQLNANNRAIYSRSTVTFTLTANHDPHTIGLATNTPDVTVTVGPPSEIIRANLILGTNIRKPVNIRDEFWWNRIPSKTISSAVPSDLYYNLAWPLGQINLYPIPSTAYQLELLTSVLFTQIADTATSYDLPYGYQAALRLLTAKKAASSFGQQWTSTQDDELSLAVALAWGDNNPIPELNTRDAGMPSAGNSAYDYRTGFNERS